MLDGRCGILKLTIQISLTPKKFKSGGKKKERKKKKKKKKKKKVLFLAQISVHLKPVSEFYKRNSKWAWLPSETELLLSCTAPTLSKMTLATLTLRDFCLHLRTFLEIHFIHLDNKEISWSFKIFCTICSIFHRMLFIS